MALRFWLNDLRSTFKKTGSGNLRFNENAKGQDVVMKGKNLQTHDHGKCQCSNRGSSG